MEEKTLMNVIEEFNITLQDLSEFLISKGLSIEVLPETKITNEIYLLVKNKFNTSSDATSVYSDNQNNTETYTDEDNTTKLYNENINFTKTYEDEIILDKTKTYNDKTTPKNLKTKRHNLGIGDNIILKEKKYTIIGIISKGTGEAVIYKIENESKEILALKLYFEFSNEKHEPNPETLERIKKIIDEDILKLIDFGVGIEKYQGKYCFEISEFAKGGDLLSVNNFKEKYTSKFIEKIVIPEIFNGIKKLHSQKIFHCDLKPGNVFYLDEEQNDIIIGDYGSAKAYDILETKEVIKTSTVKGSNFYLAPEQSRGLVSEKNDYYSFGMILLHLLYPEQFARKDDFTKIDKYKFETIVERGDSSEKLIEYNVNYKRINKLIEGLTLTVRKNRWGENEVQLWTQGKEDDLKIKYLSENAVINLSGNKTITTEDELIEYLYTNDNWKEELLEDETTKRELDNWLNINYKKDKRVEVNKLLKYTELSIDSLIKPDVARNEKIDYTKQAFIRFLRPEFPISINEDTFTLTDGSINDNLNKLISKLDSVWDTFSIEKIRFILFQVETSLRRLMIGTNEEITFSLKNLLIKIYSGLNINKNEFDLTDFKSEITKVINLKDERDSLKRIVNLFYAFDSERFFKYKKTICKTIEELGLFFVGNKSLFNNLKIQTEKDRFLQKINKSELSNLPYQEFIFEIFKNEAIANIEYSNLTFDKHRDFKVNYKYYKSLTEFLKTKNIQKEFTSRSDNTELFTYRRKFLQKLGNVCAEFIEYSKKKHNISQLSRSNTNTIKKRFVSDSYKQFIKVYEGQVFALAILLIIIFSVLYHNDTKTNYPPPIQRTNTRVSSPTKVINRSAYIKADPIGNIRSGTSTDYSILTSLNKGEQIYVIEQDKATDWYKVRYGNNNIGYVSDVVVSFDYVAKNKYSQENIILDTKEVKTFPINKYDYNNNFKNITDVDAVIPSSIQFNKINRLYLSNGIKKEGISFSNLSSLKIAQLNKSLKENMNLTISIEGHTSSDGNGKINSDGALFMANTLKNILVKQGVSKNRIKTKSFGEGRPNYTNKTIEGRRKNNRLEIKVLSKNKAINKTIFIGAWKIDNGNSKYTFNSSGRGNYKNSRGKDFSFRWSVNNNYLKITLDRDNSVWNWKINSFSNNQINMYSSKRNLHRTISK